MKTFKTFLAEIFDRPVSWKRQVINSNNFVYEFFIDETRYVIRLWNDQNHFLGDEGYTHAMWEVSFQVENNGFLSYDVTRRNSDQFKVFSTLYNVVISHFSEYKLKSGDTITFTAQQTQSQARVYRQLAARWSNMLNLAVKETYNTYYRWRLTKI